MRALLRGILIGLFLVGLSLPGRADAAEIVSSVVSSGTCTKIAPQSQFLDPIISRDPVMHYWDPIVYPGVYGYFAGGPHPFDTGTHGPAHWHNFFGNLSLNPFGVKDADAPTTCTGGFRGDFWTPSLLGYNATFPVQGLRIDPRTLRYQMAEPLPPGFAFIARTVFWDCGPGTARSDVPLPCQTGTVQAVVQFRPAAKLKVRVDFAITGKGYTHLSVGGVPIAAQADDGTWYVVCSDSGEIHCEDEHSFHMDVLNP